MSRAAKKLKVKNWSVEWPTERARGWTPEAFLAALSRRPTYYYLPKRKAKRFYFWLGREAEGDDE